MTTIILDTNFLLIPFTLNVDIFDGIRAAAEFPYDLSIIDKSIDELNKISADKNLKAKDRNAAKLALSSLKAYSIKTIKTAYDKDADSLIIDYCKANPDTVVATQDLELRRRLRAIDISLIVLRQKKYVVFQRY